MIILRNLLANAAKFTEAGTISVWATANEADHTVALHVQDTGIGITPADQAHVFERFRQVDGSSSRKYQGTGIGLALSRQLAELMGHAVRREPAWSRRDIYPHLEACGTANSPGKDASSRARYRRIKSVGKRGRTRAAIIER